MKREILIFNPDQIAIAITTYYPKYDEADSSDRIRGSLAISLIQTALINKYKLSIVDGGSNSTFLDKLREMGVDFSTQKKGGMAQSRFQAYDKTSCLKNIKVIAWIEAEKAPLISSDLKNAADLIIEGKTKIVVPARNQEGLNSLPKFQKISELSANSILHTTLEKYKKEYNLFPNLDIIPKADWYFGPKMFDKCLIQEFTNKTKFWKKFQDYLQSSKPELVGFYGYCGPLILPVIYAFHNDIPVTSYEFVSYIHPPEQTALESNLPKIFLTRRVEQLAKINLIIDEFCKYLTQQDSR